MTNTTYSYDKPNTPHSNLTPAVWVFPWSTTQVTGTETPVLLGRDPYPTRLHTDQASFFHVPARKLYEGSECEITDSKVHVNLPLATANIMEYYTGLQKEPAEYAKSLQILHHEKSSLFTGPSENRQVICVSICLGRNLSYKDLCHQDSKKHFPAHLNSKQISEAKENRRYIWPIHFRMAMENITQHTPRNFKPFAPGNSPFETKWAGYEGRVKTKPIQANMVWMLETMNEKVFAPLSLDSKAAHPTLERWTSNNHMQACRQKLERS